MAGQDLFDSRKHEIGNVVIDERWWIGMNAVVLHNVRLGDIRILAAGAVVKDSFGEGYKVLAGVLNRKECKQIVDHVDWHGFVHTSFSKFRRQHSSVEVRELADGVAKIKTERAL